MNKRASDLTDINLMGLNEGRFMIAHENFPNGRSRLCNSAAGCGFSRLAALLSRACPFPHDDKAAASARRPRGKRPGRRGAGRDETRRDDPRGAQAGHIRRSEPAHAPSLNYEPGKAERPPCWLTGHVVPGGGGSQQRDPGPRQRGARGRGLCPGHYRGRLLIF